MRVDRQSWISASTGTSPHRFLLGRRLQRARDLSTDPPPAPGRLHGTAPVDAAWRKWRQWERIGRRVHTSARDPDQPLGPPRQAASVAHVALYERKVEITPIEQPPQLGAPAARDIEADVGMRAGKAGQQVRQRSAGEVLRHAEPYDRTCTGVEQRIPRFGRQTQDAARIAQ